MTKKAFDPTGLLKQAAAQTTESVTPADERQTKPLPEGELNIIELFNQQHPIESLMTESGLYTKPAHTGAKWLYKKSESRMAGVDVKDGRMYSHHGSDPLHGKSLDSFALMEALRGFTQRQAIIYAAQNTLADPGGSSSKTVDEYNKTVRGNLEVRSLFANSNLPGGKQGTDAEPAESARARLASLSCTHRYSKMKENMSDDRFIFDGLALQGQVTSLLAKPNGAKTLMTMWFIVDGIKTGLIKGKDVFYLNADDNYGGLTTKAGIALRCGFEMISPAEARIPTEDILDLLGGIAATDECEGCIIILDTLRKFNDTMCKTTSKRFYELLRQMTAKNATVIILGHANKHLSADDELIPEGTNETSTEVDAMYGLYPMSHTKTATGEEFCIEFRSMKSRGNNLSKVQYTYEKKLGGSYQDLLDSVCLVTDATAEKQRDKQLKADVLNKYKLEIEFLDKVIGSRSMNQTQIMAAYDTAKKDNLSIIDGITRNRFMGSLNELNGYTLKVVRGGRNAKLFSIIQCDALLPPTPPEADESDGGWCNN